MAENQRPAHDLVTKRDLILRGLMAIGLIVMALVLLLAAQPA
jgi:hypothetical protein